MAGRVTRPQVPEGVAWAEVVKYVYDNHAVEMSGGLGPTVGKARAQTTEDFARRRKKRTVRPRCRFSCFASVAISTLRQVWRVGLMGYNAKPERVAQVLAGLPPATDPLPTPARRLCCAGRSLRKRVLKTRARSLAAHLSREVCEAGGQRQPRGINRLYSSSVPLSSPLTICAGYAPLCAALRAALKHVGWVGNNKMAAADRASEL